MSLLLENAKSAEIGQSELLLEQTHAALLGDLEGLHLLLHHQAVVDLENGRVVQIAAAAGSLQVLDLLLKSEPAPSTIQNACLAAVPSTISCDQKQSILERLLTDNEGLSASEMSKFLTVAVKKFPEYTQLPQLLLARRATVQFQALRVAVEKSSRQLFAVLAGDISDDNMVVETFRHARQTTMSPARRYWIYSDLLKKGIPRNEISKALAHVFATDGLDDYDLLIPKLLLENGADVGFNNGAAFSLALKANSLAAVKLLSQYLTDDRIAHVVFDSARGITCLDPRVRAEFYRYLLQWNIGESSMYHALVDNLKEGNSEISLIQTLLEKGADPNKKKAQCFVLASSTGAKRAFRALSKYAKLSAVLEALLSHFQTEQQVIFWVNVCLEEQPQSTKIDLNKLLVQCMRKLPRGTALLKILLNHGSFPSAKINHRLCDGWEPEQCTILIWALFSKEKIENAAILVLLERGGKAVLPTYSTPVSKLSAAFGCLLDKTRAPVLSALLKLDRDNVLSYKVPVSTLGYLGAFPKQFDQESSCLNGLKELPLRLACLYLGNFDAFRLLKCEETPDDTTLHLAALMALPKFVNWLLEFHDPNHKAEDYDMMIPLALVCHSESQSWCKIANEESDWKIRQQETMKFLAPNTSPEWRYRNMTVLHIALQNGLDASKAMIEALNVHDDPERHQKYRYVDKDGKEYSPPQYVMKFVDAKEQEKAALVECLTEGGFPRPAHEPGIEKPLRSPGSTARADGIGMRPLRRHRSEISPKRTLRREPSTSPWAGIAPGASPWTRTEVLYSPPASSYSSISIGFGVHPLARPDLLPFVWSRPDLFHLRMSGRPALGYISEYPY